MSASQSIHAVEVHADGEPGRVIISGVPDVPGRTMFEKRVYFEQHHDDLRQRMLREPRGYPGLCCNVLMPPTQPGADAGFIIMEQSEYPPMSGSNTICVTTVLIELGLVEVREPVTTLVLEAPAGLITVHATVREGRCTAVSFDNVPAFVGHLDARIEVPELGEVIVDVAYGGMWYVIADADVLGIPLTPDHAGSIARAGAMIRAAAAQQLPVVHPENPAIANVSIAQLSGASSDAAVSRRNAVVICAGELDWARPETWRGVLDRSPCGTGTCAKMATLHARGELDIGEDYFHQGILDTVWTGRLLSTTSVGEHPAVAPRISGRGWIYGRTEYCSDAHDPFPDGYMVADIWPRGH